MHETDTENLCITAGVDQHFCMEGDVEVIK